MITSVRNWYIVTVMDGEQLVGEVLHGTVADDQTFRFFEGDYVTTSRIVSMDVKAQQVITASNSYYALKGSGKRFYHGGSTDLNAIKQALKYSNVEFEFAVAQPGVAVSQLDEDMNRFLNSIYSTVIEMTETKLMCYFSE